MFESIFAFKFFLFFLQQQYYNFNKILTKLIKGQIYHRIGSLQPHPEKQPAFLQIYFMGSDVAQTNRRLELISNRTSAHRDIVTGLQTMLHSNNNYIRSFKTAIELGKDITGDYKVIIRADKRPSNQHPGRFNEPQVDEVAILMVGEGGPRDIVLHSRDAPLKIVQDIHRSYDALQYPLLFPRGEDGYDATQKQVSQYCKYKNYFKDY